MTRLFFAALLLGLVGACVADPSLPEPTEPTALDRAVIAELEAEAVPGLQVAVFRDGAIVFQGSWGLADTESGRRVAGDTLFTAASVSKLVTTTAVLLAVASGELSLDEPIDVGFEVAHPTGAVPTLRQLLSHTGGIDDHWDTLEPLYTDGDPELSLRELLREYLVPGGAHHHPERSFTRWGPGEGLAYSNVGMALAALAVEHGTGTDFATYCRRHIFEPLGMDHTAWHLADIDVGALAVPTEWRRGFEPVDHYGFPDYPSGSLRTSATQLATFLLALFEGDLLPADLREQMLEPHFPEHDPAQGLGFFWWTLDDVPVVGHDGGEVGIASEALVRPSRRDGVVLLANGDLGPGAFARLERLLLDAAR